MKIVKFEDGTYAIRKWSLWAFLEDEHWFVFLDLKDFPVFDWRNVDESYFKDCKGDLNLVLKIYNEIKNPPKARLWYSHRHRRRIILE